MMATSFVGAIFLVAYSHITLSIVAIATGFFLWAASWLNANDVLKQRIYTSSLLDCLKGRSPEEREPMIAKFYSVSSSDYIECLPSDGSVTRFKVEPIMEELPL